MSFVIPMRAPEIDEATCLSVIASRFIVTDASTGKPLWNPLVDDDPARLREAVARWLYNVRDIEIDPANPLSYLLLECGCQRGLKRNCRVHGSATDVAALQRRRARDVYERTGSVAETADHFGVSFQRIQRLLRTDKQHDSEPR